MEDNKLVVKCGCGASYAYPEKIAHKQIRCPRCGTPIVLPPDWYARLMRVSNN